MTTDEFARAALGLAKKEALSRIGPGMTLSKLDRLFIDLGISAALHVTGKYLADREADLRAKAELLEAKISVLEAELAGKDTAHVRRDAGRAPTGPHAGPLDPN